MPFEFIDISKQQKTHAFGKLNCKNICLYIRLSMKIKQRLQCVYSAASFLNRVPESSRILAQSTSEQALDKLVGSSFETAKLMNNDNMTTLLAIVGDSEIIEFTIECVGDVCELYYKNKVIREKSSVGDNSDNNIDVTIFLSRMCIRLFVACITHKLTEFLFDVVFKT